MALEASNDGAAWQTITYYTPQPGPGWTHVETYVPFWTRGPNTQFRWRQSSHSGAGQDTWALDNVCLRGVAPEPPLAPPFITVNSISSRAIAILWIEPGGGRVRNYEVQRAMETTGWQTIAKTGSDQTWWTDTNCAPSTTYAYRIKATNAGGDSPFTMVAFGTTISQATEWQVENLGSSNASLTEVGPDGVSFLARYAFNLDATEPIRAFVPGQTDAGAPAVSFNNATGELGVVFLRRKASMNPGVTYQVQFSDDLNAWTISTGVVSITSLDEIWEVVRYTGTSVGGNARFCRVVVTASP